MAEKPHVNPKMITLAREARSMTQMQLADQLGCKQGTLSKIENGTLSSPEGFEKTLSEALRYPVSFFYQHGESITPTLQYYRKNTQVTKLEKGMAEATMNIIRLNLEKLLSSVEIPERNFKFWDVEEHGTPQMCARYVRDLWHIPKGRIDNLTKVLEDNGIIVIHANFTSSKINGLSMFLKTGHPIIFLNKNMPGDRLRFTLAHELGHLLLHFGKPLGTERDVEIEASEFASELLMPELEIIAQLRRLTLDRLTDLKLYWRVSMQALTYRANKIGAITSHQYRYLFTQFGRAGYRTNEPVLIAKEEPSLVTEVIQVHLDQLNYSREEIADMLSLHLDELIEFYLKKEERAILRVIR